MSPLPAQSEPIAIVGWSCRFPGQSNSPSKLWELLCEPRDVRQEFGPERLNLGRFYNKDGSTHGATDVKGQGYLLTEDSRLFDPAFFGISPLEADGMDPQQRILLEAVYETFEAAGYTLEQMRSSNTSVHVGVMTNDYSDIQMRDMETVPQYTATGTGRSILSNRISYVFDLNGPSITIDTACSSSLVAVHQAIQAMQSGDCKAAIVGGVNLILDPSMYIMESKLHMLSPDSQSRMWSSDANGYARGEGVAAMMLKPLSEAIQDNDDIRGLIRGTGVNSDGHSQGITMPKASAQAELIRSTYRRAGLDPISDRPQYFECHGTGTKAGDPVEARAIFEAFIEQKSDDEEDAEEVTSQAQQDNEQEPMYVGSVKTVIGHLEGCAGLAGLIKAALAIENRTIPPNMLFSELNPEIKDYYGQLQIAAEARPWPAVASEQPLRASVNSFGFGGTNAHAILESYKKDSGSAEGQSQVGNATQVAGHPVGPFVVSGFSSASLLGNLGALLQLVKDDLSLNLDDVAWALQTRRSSHRVKAHFVADDREQLIERLEEFLTASKAISSREDVGICPKPVNSSEEPGILGVFTGQGAQWPSMGRGLLKRSPVFRQALERCDAFLKALFDGPQWSLIAELEADASTSRVGQAEISQPLCTAVQIGLVDMLQAAGVEFSAVVGHSSGEIAAVYSCGIITLEGAIQIAFYRGKWAKLAHGPNASGKGAMMAAGMTLEEAEEFCASPKYQGRLGVAASNGPQSVTLSGDADAIAEAKEELDEKKQFARLLQVDTAYHSHHMQSCASKYLDSLTACNIQVSQPRPGCVWNSSVRGDTELLYGDLSSLKGTYWVQNMVQPVLFQQAVKSSIWHGGPFDLGVEVGPHPALKGPTEQTLKSAFGSAPAYTGVLKRGGNDVQELFSAIGNYWAQLGPSFVEFEGLRKSFASAPPNPSVLAKLPSYCWDHDKVYWRESRISRKFRQGQDYAHELLGRRSADDTDREMRWRNVLKASELPWVAGHEILGEVLLPGAAYVSLAFEAAMRIAMASAAKRRITLLEIQDMNIHRPIVVPTTKEGIETIFTTHILGSSDADTLEVSFVYHYCPDERIGSLVNTCDGRLLIHLGDGSEQQPQLPSRAEVQGSTASSDDLLPVNTKSMYELLKETGLNYTGLFKRLQQAKRKLGYAVSDASWEISEFSDSYVAHPAVLDVCFQSLFIARSSPDVSHVYATPLPVHIKRLALDPNVSWASASSNSIDLAIESFITKQDGSYLDGDLHIYDANSGDAILQVETLAVNPVAEPTAEQDSDIFSSVSLYADPSWRLTELDRNSKLDERETVLAYDVERVTLYYVQYVLKAIDVSERPKLAWHHQCMLEAFEQMVEEARSGQHAYASPEWLDDDREILDALIAKHPDVIDMIACQRVGENMLAVVRGEIQILELMMENNILERVYMEACGWVIIIEALVSTLKQLAHKFPRANILEIGAGTGGTTWTLFQTISDAIGTYTYTDISTGFFEAAANKFADYKDKMIFKALDVSADPEPQGYEKGTYDIIVATNVLHATPELNTTLANTRSLLKPGGYLVLVETSGISIMRSRFVMAGMPGWYLGADDGRRLHPGLSTEGWNERLTEVGFSGVDSVFYDSPDYEKHLVSLMVTQAVNDTVVQLRNPLSVNISPKKQSTCLLIGGKTLTASKVLQSIKDVLRSIGYKNIKKAATVEAVNLSSLSRGVDVICLQELDKPLFSSDISASALSALQRLFLQTKNIIWVTQNRLAGNPRCNMMLGIMRALKQELPQMNAQMVDLERIANAPSAARTIMETFMRLRIISEHEHDEEPLLWLQESELIASADHMLIPRVIPDQGINERHNAKYRYVNNTASSADTAAQVVSQRRKLVLVEPEVTGYTDDKTTVQVNVEYSLQAPLLSMARVYICVGHNADTQQAVIALSEVNGSMIRVLEQKLISISSADVSISTIEAVAAHIIAREASCDVQHHEAALFYNIPAGTRSNIIQEEFQRQEKQVFFASSSSSTPTDWIRLPANSSVRAMRALIPRQVALFVNCSDIPIRNSTSLYNSLSVGCKTTEDVVFQQHLAAAYHDLSLKDVYDSIKGSLKIFADAAPSHLVVEANDIVGREDSTLSESIITSWKSSVPYVLAQQPADRTALFHPNKTYLMSGMAGGLGLSICGWALRQGAKNLIIASRNPQISPEWLQEAKNLGANVQVVKMDATDKASVQYVVDNVCTIMPPVAGICNAAMVLHDSLFMDMDADSMNRCLRPKVDGSWNLHTAFANVALDFFILLGSGASIVGNPGQSNYHAANEFMVALAGQRRQQGQAASIIHIGAVMDIGYVSRQSAGHKAAFQALQVPLISETDVHYAFAEAIFAGRKDSTRSFEVIVGISRIKKFLEEGERPAWLNDPRCSHLTSTVKVQTQQRSENAASSHNLRGQMESAHTEEEALPTLRDACCAKLESMMQLPEGSVDVDRSMIDIGIDSLVAVEIRTWFLKELGSDIPVLKILGGHSVATICVIAAQQLLAKRLAISQKTDDSQNDIPHINAVDSDNISSSGNSEHQDSPGQESPESLGSSLATTNTALGLADDSTSDSEQIVKSESISSLDKDTDQLTSEDEISQGKPRAGVKDLQRHAVSHESNMTTAQSRIWVLSKYLSDPTTYNLAFLFEVAGDLDVNRFRSALMLTMQHHQSFRTCFYSRDEDAQPMQAVLFSPITTFKHIQATDDDCVSKEWEAAKSRHWDIERGDTMSVTVLSHEDSAATKHGIIFAYHHIIMDAVSWRIFLTDLNAAYNMRPLKTRGLTCIDYTQHQLKEAKSEYYQTQLKYWRKEFASAPQVMPLLSTAKTRLRPNTQSTKTHYAWREINEKLSAKIKSACQITKTTPFHFHLAVIQAFFSLSLSANEICIGVADSNRITSHYSETVGFFMNMLPVRLPLIRKARFSRMMQSTSRKVFTALENSAVSFDAILNDLKVARSASHTPLFQVAVNYRNGAVRDIPLGNTVMVMRDAQDAKNPYDISFGIVEASQDQSMVEVTFQGSLYDEPACQEILDSYMRLVEAFSSNPSGFVNDNDFYSPEGVSKAVALGQGPQVEFDWPSTLPERFLDMATRWKDQPAIRQGTASFTYGELRGRVASLAAELQKVVCVAGSRIVVLCEPSVDFITSLLAILHIGGIYIPLDVSLPLPRHETMVKTCKPSLVICHKATHAPAKSLAKHLPLGLLNIDDIGHDDSQSTKPVASDPKSAAFILFTSGSTGTPKGVMLSQANFINHIALKSNRLDLKEERENVLQQSSLGFDMSLVQIFCALGNGGTLVIIPHESRWDPSYITNAILRDNVTLTIATPSEYKLWLEYGETLSQANQWRHACLGGEPITGQLVRRFSSLGCDRLTLTNCYGPTEITAAAAFHTVSAVETKGVPGESIVGKALPNYQVYILDNQGRPMPPGFAGEICIGGSGLALGYLDSAEQTNSKFIKSPFREGRVYRTGDMGRLEQDGSLVLMGRLDGNTQIKLGGIRMELTEIEEAVMNVFDGQLVNVVVTVRGDALVAHATAASGREINHTKSQTLLQELPLPQYMRPSQIFLVDQLPMTSNGKVDRKAAAELPLPAETTSSEARGSSKFNLQEGELRLLWDKILVHKQGLSPDSDFFLAGGNSIQLIKLQHAIRESMGVLVPTQKLYRACTLRDMSAVIQSQKGSQEHDEEINWEEETSWKQTQLHELSQLVSHREAKTGDNSGAHILLTGANSFLGTAILDTLVKNEAVAGVYCIAILPDEVDKVPSSNDKVVTYAGSLSLPTLGLDNAQRADLQNTVDVVIHAGANGHCLNNYSSVRAGNVQSTRFLASLAVAAQVPLLFVSSNRVTLLSGNNSLPPVSVAAHHPPTTGEEGFTASKWASEQLLEKLVHFGHSGQDFGLDVQIHRPCIVIGDDAPSSDALNNILRFSRAISTIPYYENMGGYLDLKPVEQVAGDIASAAMEMISSYAGVTSSVRYRHHSGGEKVSIDGMQKHMERMYNCTLERLDIREWIPKATEAGLDEMISVYLLSLLETGTTLQFPYLGEQ
ncbi:hypothetical protein LMH87_004915 [Akanthomyces muscarius]|uniref:Polyketide synthase n=1 Tax=Akanthomyces muscarius TaxID=2231603 RepID=A0A9W8QJN9_AKAMU|nr:hypothetical protein LMH87_004915 [Akanthomyces muscarius]KAJ4163171.1 hypothetical protein LMH87_004915 [Akanthomyces muscarius]